MGPWQQGTSQGGGISRHSLSHRWPHPCPPPNGQHIWTSAFTIQKWPMSPTVTMPSNTNKIFNMTHDLKIRPEYFEAIIRGDKTFEVRFNDRNYQVDDILHLKEYDGNAYTGRELTAKVAYLLDKPSYCKDGLVIMARKFYL